MSEEVVVENEMSRYGLRRLHVMRMGQPVESSNWLQYVPAEARHLAETFRWFEAGLDMHHLCLAWQARETMAIQGDGGKRQAVLWFIDVRHGENLRFGIDLAAILFEQHYARQPDEAVVKRMPKDAPEWMTTEGGAGFAPVKVKLVEEEWVPERYVVVR